MKQRTSASTIASHPLLRPFATAIVLTCAFASEAPAQVSLDPAWTRNFSVPADYPNVTLP